MSASSTPTDVAEAVLAVMRIMRPRVDSVMSAHGLSLARGKVLSVIQRDSPCRPGAIAAQLGQSPRTLTDAVDALERDGLVARQPDPSDRRAQLLVLTEAGVAALRTVEAPRRGVMDQLFDCLDASEREQLVVMLRRVEAAAKGGEGV
jgi:DNA-binding MarR family transcriptional regulator